MESLEATFINDSLNDAIDNLRKIRDEANLGGFDGLREFACGQLAEACQVARDAVANVLIIGECLDQLPFHIRTVGEIEDREAVMDYLADDNPNATLEVEDPWPSAIAAAVGALEFDFGDGKVPAHQHPNGEGWVADTATVADTAYIGVDARVSGNARVSDHAQVSDHAWVYGNARVFGDAWVSGYAQVSGDAQVFGDAWVSGYAQVSDHAQVSGNEEVFGNKEAH